MLAGILLVTLPSVMLGGLTVLMHLVRRLPGYVDNPLRHDLWRAGHAHAGVYLVLSLVMLRYVDVLSVWGPSATKASPLIALAYPGAAALALAVLVLGRGLIRAARAGA
jgi:hypothetical protein